MPKRKTKSPQKAELEFTIGGKIFTAIGVVAMVFGMAYFFKYAIEQGLLSETIRLIIGGLVGFLALGLGQGLRGKFKLYSQLLSAGGLVILYLTSYASFNFYGLVDWSFSALGMALVAVLGVLLALRENSQLLAGFTQLGALFVPFFFEPLATHPHVVFAYFALLNLLVLAISTRKTWKSLTWMTLLVTQFFVFAQTSNFQQSLTFLVYELVYFLSIMGVLYFQERVKKVRCTELDEAMVFVTGFGTAGGIYAILDVLAPTYPAVGFLLIAMVYFLLACSPSAFKTALLNTSVLLLFLGAVVQWDGYQVILAWSVLSLLMSGIVYKSKESNIVLKLLMGVIVIASMSWLGENASYSSVDKALWNTRLAVELATVLAGFTASSVILKKKPELAERWSAYIVHSLSHVILVTALLGEWKLSIEQSGLSWPTTDSLVEFGSSGILGVYSLILLAVGLKAKSKAYRLAFLGLMTITITKVFLFDVAVLETLYKFIAFFVLGLILLSVGYYYNSHQKEVKKFIKGA